LSIAPVARHVIEGSLGGASVKRVTTLADQVDASIVPERLLATLAAFFGAVATLLAAIGLYGLLAFTVTRRTREIGVRMALGATRSHVIGMVLRNVGWLVTLGLAVGAPAAYWSQRLAASMLENMPQGGAFSIAAGAAALVTVALVAAYVPVRRAIQVEPLIALRSE
jgi:ABC-type antimicrobial peptide transport system permease subunit